MLNFLKSIAELRALKVSGSMGLLRSTPCRTPNALQRRVDTVYKMDFAKKPSHAKKVESSEGRSMRSSRSALTSKSHRHGQMCKDNGTENIGECSITVDKEGENDQRKGGRQWLQLSGVALFCLAAGLTLGLPAQAAGVASKSFSFADALRGENHKLGSLKSPKLLYSRLFLDRHILAAARTSVEVALLEALRWLQQPVVLCRDFQLCVAP